MLDKNQILQELESVENLEQLQSFYKKYLWKKWLIAQEFKTFWQLSPEERKEKGQFLTALKEELETKFKEKQKKLKFIEINKKLEQDYIDINTPGVKPKLWHYTLIAKERRRIEEIFHSMWFNIEYGHDLVSKYENFYAVNIPPTHPATEMHDTFYIDEESRELVLRTHTSAMQNALIKKYGIPLKVIVPWRVYRFERTDASHDTVFWQVEGMVIDKGINLTHFKQVINEILSAIFEAKVDLRMRPAFFPFVEPGFEIDASCPICKWKGCSLCKKTWWIEILWAGMIHPNVLKEAGINPNEGYRGFAFGMWLTRLVAIKYGIKDIRYFNAWDLRFIESF